MPGPRQPGSPLREGSPSRAGRPLQAGGSDDRRTGYRWVGCDRCGAADGKPSALIEGCASLRDSIERAVREGRLEVSPP